MYPHIGKSNTFFIMTSNSDSSFTKKLNKLKHKRMTSAAKLTDRNYITNVGDMLKIVEMLRDLNSRILADIRENRDPGRYHEFENISNLIGPEVEKFQDIIETTNFIIGYESENSRFYIQFGNDMKYYTLDELVQEVKNMQDGVELYVQFDTLPFPESNELLKALENNMFVFQHNPFLSFLYCVEFKDYAKWVVKFMQHNREDLSDSKFPKNGLNYYISMGCETAHWNVNSQWNVKTSDLSHILEECAKKSLPLEEKYLDFVKSRGLDYPKELVVKDMSEFNKRRTEFNNVSAAEFKQLLEEASKIEAGLSKS